MGERGKLVKLSQELVGVVTVNVLGGGGERQAGQALTARVHCRVVML